CARATVPFTMMVVGEYFFDYW
nr:immunoglobulin heavy chain junction region [Macaca mulatta]MOW75483.1 immunoglobulin heavy chain junction region [Macaca mulatta]MOW75972.1 immunoglobulin heavy chain junction region [Macaca mulatta]MOW77673.1 immunoglobulin heavy chain junction region [Macaca mulatta]MOW80934.1 immunoglobulin heavy chain junction region [Macaca mulatta]